MRMCRFRAAVNEVPGPGTYTAADGQLPGAAKGRVTRFGTSGLTVGLRGMTPSGSDYSPQVLISLSRHQLVPGSAHDSKGCEVLRSCAHHQYPAVAPAAWAALYASSRPLAQTSRPRCAECVTSHQGFRVYRACVGMRQMSSLSRGLDQQSTRCRVVKLVHLWLQATACSCSLPCCLWYGLGQSSYWRICLTHASAHNHC